MMSSKERHFAPPILKAQGTPGTSGRSISRNFAEEYFERVRSYQGTHAQLKPFLSSFWLLGGE